MAGQPPQRGGRRSGYAAHTTRELGSAFCLSHDHPAIGVGTRLLPCRRRGPCLALTHAASPAHACLALTHAPTSILACLVAPPSSSPPATFAVSACPEVRVTAASDAHVFVSSIPCPFYILYAELWISNVFVSGTSYLVLFTPCILINFVLFTPCILINSMSNLMCIQPRLRRC